MVEVGFFGGSGFLGSAFDEYSYENEHDIQLTILSRSKKNGIKSHFMPVDALLEDHLNNLPRYDVIIHGIADSTNGPRLSDHEKIGKQLQCTLNISAYCLRKKVRRLIFLSSGAVYGNTNLKIEDVENYCFDLNSKQNAYALAKLTSEQYLKSFCAQHSIELSILRCFTFAGPRIPKNSHYAFSNFIEAACSGRDIAVKGTGADVRSYLHHDDFAQILREVIIREEVPTIMNVGSSEDVTIKSLAEKIANKHENCKVHILNKTQSVNEHYVPNIQKLKKFFPRFAPIELEKIIDESILFHG